MKTLPPQPLTDSTWLSVEKQLKEIFYELIFLPLLRVINVSEATQIELKNSASYISLLIALRSGRVQYLNGEFTGNFSVAISREIRSFGGVFDSRSKTYWVNRASVPESVKAEAALYRMKSEKVHKEIKLKLDEMQTRMDERLEHYEVDASAALGKIESGFRQSAKALTIEPHIDEARQRQLKLEYNDNIKLYIKNFSFQSIQELREDVDANAMQGYRADRLREMIKNRYGVTVNKAKFLARQETSLFMSKYRQQRFAQAGVTWYKWSTAHDERVRKSHKYLQGRVFSYDDPPITDPATGARNNPGQDFGCRCLDIPILDKVVDFV